MITRAYIYRRTITRPAIYFIFAITGTGAVEIFAAISTVTQQLYTSSEATMILTENSTLHRSIADDSTLRVNKTGDSTIETGTAEASFVSPLFTAISKVDG